MSDRTPVTVVAQSNTFATCSTSGRMFYNWLRAAAVGLATFAGTAFLTPAALALAGFTTAGVAAGSLAAAAQSLFYGGATCGIFSLLQSLGATGVIWIGAAAAGVATALGLLAHRK